MNRREFLKSALTLAALTPMAGFLMRAEEKKALSPATVYFTPEISPESVIRMYHALGTALPGNVAVKVHSGEKGNQNYQIGRAHV